MTPETAIKFLTALGSKGAKFEGGEWVKAPCPLSRWTHQNGRDSNPSFGVNVKKSPAYYHCFSCNAGSLVNLIQELEMHLQKTPQYRDEVNVKAARYILENEDTGVEPLPEFSEFAASEHEFQEWPEYFIESFQNWKYSSVAAKYLAGRGVSMQTADSFGLKFDSAKQMIVAPYFNMYGKLSGARGRSVEQTPQRKHHDYTWNAVNNSYTTWFNEQVIANEEPLVVVEGQFDAMRVASVYPNVVANLTAKPVLAKMAKLVHAPAVILMLDNDTTGDIAIQKYVEYLDAHHIPCAVAQPPKLLDADGKLIKEDPDSMGSEWIREQLKSLEII